MWSKKTRTTVQPNNKKKSIRLALLASVLTVVAAGIFIWRVRTSKSQDALLSKTRRKAGGDMTDSERGSGIAEVCTADEGKRYAERCAVCRYQADGGQTGVRSRQSDLQVQPYLGSSRKRKKSTRRRGRRMGRRVFASVAAVLAIVMVGGNVLEYINPTATVMARESFGGIKQIVEEHNEDNPFVILDIVPGKAVYTVNGVTYDLSLGTIGYFVNGQAPVGQDLKRIFTGEGNTAFYAYTDRQDLVDQVMVSDSVTGVSYQEGYGGTGEELSAGNGWIKIFDMVSAGDDAEDGTGVGTGAVTGSVPTGRLYARVEALDSAAGDGSHAGYDYELKSGNIDIFRKNTVLNLGDGAIYIADEQGGYHVIFGNPTEGIRGYRVRVVSTDWRNYSDATGVYQWDGAAYQYVSTVKELKESLGEEEGDGEEEEPKDDESDPKQDDNTDEDDKKDDATDEDGNEGDNPDEGDNEGGDNPGEGEGGNEGGDNPGGGEGGNESGDNPGEGEGGNEGGDNPGEGEGGNEGGDNPGGGEGGNEGGDNSGGGGSNEGGDNSGGEGGNEGGDNPGEGGGSNEGGDNSGGAGGDAGNSNSSNEGANAAASQEGDSAFIRWYRCIEPGVSDEGNTGNNSGSTDGDAGNNGGTDDSGNAGGDAGNNGGTGDSGSTGGDAGNNGDTGDSGSTGGDAGNNGGTGDSGSTGGAAGNNGDDTGDSGSAGGDAGNNGGTGNNGDGTTEDGSVGTGTQPAEGEVGAYYILTFEYVSELEEAEILYQVVDQTLIDTTEGASRPIDSYSVLGMSESDTADNKLAAAEAEESNVAAIFTYVGSGNGTYKLTRERSAEKQNVSADEQNSVEAEDSAYYVEVQNAPVYIRCSGGNDWLKRYVFNSLNRQDNQSGDFAIKVNTVTAGEVTYEMIQDADLVYLEDGSGLYLNVGAAKHYIGSDDGSDTTDDAALGDISEVVIERLLYGTVEELKPVIVDYGIITNSQDYQDTKYQKLAKAFLKKDLAAFYDEMSKSDNLAQSVLMNVDKESSDYPNKKDNNYHYVNRNVYIVNGTALVSSDFPEEMSRNEAKAGFSEVLAAIRAENTTLSEEDKISEKISKAKAVQYIINFSVGLIGDYKNLAILELQPTANGVSDLHRDVNEDRGSVVLYWQREDQGGAGQQILRSSKKIETNVTIKSVVEFNGEYEDINSRYDMIFIGLDGQNLYRERNKDGDLETVYNDEELNGKVYHTGDRVAYGDSRYDANDISLQKKEALLDYLRAGYPIVVENDCFKGKSAKEAQTQDINTHYIAENTQMYEFLKEAIALNRSDEDAEDGSGIYTIEDVHSSAMFMAQLNTIRPLIEQRTAEGNEDASDIIATERTPEGEYKGAIEYRIFSDRAGEDKSYNGELTKHLYLDMNYDGIFMPDEEVYEYLDESADGGGRISVNFKEVCFGIVPWKLEVSDAGNRYRRDAIQGYFTIYGQDEATVRVLQVLDNTELTAANMQVQYEEMTNSMLRYYLNGAEQQLGMEFKIETVTPAVLAERLTKNGAYLTGWDVVVLGFGNSGHPGDTVAAAVNNYISTGGSVLVSSAGAEADKGKLGIDAQYMGQKEGPTYGALGIHSDDKHRYEGLKAVMFNKQYGLYADKINEGTISKWPYQLGMLVNLGENTEVKAPEYLLDIDAGYGETMTHATAWYTLNQSGSGVNAYNVSPRDARNNYYVYSKGNVVYVGQSEYPYIYDPASGVAPDANEKGAGETMLFVNALMSAYINSIHPAELSIVAGFSTAATKIESIAVPFDQEFKEMVDSQTSILDDTVDVYFKYVDNNLAPNKTRQIMFCYEDQAGAVPAPGGENVMVTPFTSPIWTVENNQLIEVSPDMLKPGRIYRIKAPVVALKQDDGIVNAKIYIAVQVDFDRSGQPKSVVGADSVSLNRAQLFLLE